MVIDDYSNYFQAAGKIYLLIGGKNQILKFQILDHIDISTTRRLIER